MGISQAVRKFQNIWSHGEDDDYAPDDAEVPDAAADTDGGYGRDKFESKYPASPAPLSSYASHSAPSYGGGASGGAARRLRPVAAPLRAREKNIYTLKPKNSDEAAIAADYLKTGSAVVLNLQDVDRVNAVRIIDFMSGVCYGLENQGHAMKLGDTIFLFTPGDFEISSDETDYGENPEFFFKDVAPALAANASAPAANASSGSAHGANAHGANSGAASATHSFPSAERRAWER